MRLADVSSIRGPVEALARRPWRPSLDLSSDLDSDSMRAARTAGSSDFQREATSSGTAAMFNKVRCILCNRTISLSS